MQTIQPKGTGAALMLALLSCVGLASAQTTVTQTYTSIDAYGNRTTTTIEAPAGTTLSTTTAVAPGYGYGYGQPGYGYTAPNYNWNAPVYHPYPAPVVLPQPVYSGPLHPPSRAGETPPWFTSIPLGTTTTYYGQPNYPGYPAPCPTQVPACPPQHHPYHPAPTTYHHPRPNYGYGYGSQTQSAGISYSNRKISISIGSTKTTHR